MSGKLVPFKATARSPQPSPAPDRQVSSRGNLRQKLVALREAKPFAYQLVENMVDDLLGRGNAS